MSGTHPAEEPGKYQKLGFSRWNFSCFLLCLYERSYSTCYTGIFGVWCIPADILYCLVSVPSSIWSDLTDCRKENKKQNKTMSHVALMKEKSVCAILQSDHKGFPLLKTRSNASICSISSFLPPILSCLWMCMLQAKCFYNQVLCYSLLLRSLGKRLWLITSGNDFLACNDRMHVDI